jgi:hypothetical protein
VGRVGGEHAQRGVERPEARAQLGVAGDVGGVGLDRGGRPDGCGDRLGRVGPDPRGDAPEQRRAKGRTLVDGGPCEGQVEHGGDDAQPRVASRAPAGG